MADGLDRGGFGIAQAKNRFSNGGRVRRHAEGNQFLRMAVDVKDSDIHAVGAGSGHQARHTKSFSFD